MLMSELEEFQMNADAFSRTLSELVDRRPFKAFALEMDDGTRIEIDNPRSLAYRDDEATGFARGGGHINIKANNVKKIVDETAAAPAKGMSVEEFFGSLHGLLNREPFVPFVVEMNDGSVIEFDRPRSLAIRRGSTVAGGFAKGRRLVRIDAEDVKRIIEATAAVNGG
jgi:hypothetical protein